MAGPGQAGLGKGKKGGGGEEGAQAGQGEGPLPTLTPQSSIRHVRPGALPRGQYLPGPEAWWSWALVGDPTGHLQGKQENRAPGQRQKGKLGRQQAGSPRKGPRVQLEPSWGLGTLQGPAASCKPGPAGWRVWASASSPVSTIPGTSCGGWTSPPGKGSDVRRREGRMSGKGREGGQEGGDKHAEGAGVVLLLLARVPVGPEASPRGGGLPSLSFGSKTSGLRALPAEATTSPNPPPAFLLRGCESGGPCRSSPSPPQPPGSDGRGQRRRRPWEERLRVPDLCRRALPNNNGLQERTGWRGNPKHHILGLTFCLSHPHN